MKRNQIKAMLYDLIEEIDYDKYKSYIPSCSELTEKEIDEALDKLVDIVKRHIKESKK